MYFAFFETARQATPYAYSREKIKIANFPNQKPMQRN